MIDSLLIVFIASLAITGGVFFYTKNKGKQKEIFFYAGLFYIILGLPFLYSLLFYGAIGSIFVGIVFLIISLKKTPNFIQILVSVLPIIVVSFLIWNEQSSKNIFLIPKDYKGRVVIVHGCKDGLDTEYEKSYRVYRIGKDGLLKTKFKFAGKSFDSLHSSYYYIDETGKKEELREDGSTKVFPQGLWSLHYERKGEAIIDFILDEKIENPYDYKPEENKKWQKEIDTCAE